MNCKTLYLRRRYIPNIQTLGQQRTYRTEKERERSERATNKYKIYINQKNGSTKLKVLARENSFWRQKIKKLGGSFQKDNSRALLISEISCFFFSIENSGPPC